MKKIIFSFAFIACTLTIFSQTGNIGIGTNMPDSTASLHLGATDKGFLPNKVALTSLTDIAPITKDGVTIALAAEMPDGLMVYNTATAGTEPDNVVPGYYIWDGSNTKWKSLSPTTGSGASSIYTHWGRNDCPGAAVVYSGYVAGSKYDHTGGGGNTLCLTDTPTYLDPMPGNQTSGSIYGTEYESAFPSGASRIQSEAVCSVCEVASTNIIMIPGTNVCPAGWTVQYTGYIMTTSHTHNRSDYVCADDNPNGPITNVNQNPNLWYITEIKTGALPSSIYTDNYEVTCVICSK